MTTPLHPMLHAAIVAAGAAGHVIRTAAADPASIQVRQKHPNDFVTQVDTASEQAIVQTLLEALPDHAVRSEEPAQWHGNATADHVWIVDPLDGTTNFIHGYPAHGVSIALSVRGRIEHAVVLDVARDALFHASLGEGAWCAGRRLRVSERAGLQHALVATSCPYRPGPAFERSMQMLGSVMAQVGAIRRSGSAALDLASVAAGVCDASFDRGLNAWDVAGGGLLVQEAGGVVGNFSGGPEYLETREVVAANPALQAAMVALLRPFGRPAVP